MRYSTLASPNSTITVLKRHGLYTKKSLGQHFLIDDHMIGQIITLSEVDSQDVVLEIGPGIGTLTLALCNIAGTVVAVETDAALIGVLGDTTSGCKGLYVIEADATKVPAEMLQTHGTLTALVANLPYGVAATVLLRAFQVIPSIASATVMVQKEVADRIAAAPSCKEYGAYTVKLGMLASVEGRFEVSRRCFLPSPRVDSTVLRLERRAFDHDEGVLVAASKIATAAFAQRRKTIRNSLASVSGFTRDEVSLLLGSVGVDGGCRAETLDVDTFIELGAKSLEIGLLP